MASRRILIIDDDVELCEEIRESLHSEGYIAECIHDAFKGEMLIRENDYHAILLDFKMPYQGGIDVLKKLKADNIRKPIFIFSGKSSVEREIKEADLAGAIIGIITKPIDFQCLLKRIDELRP